MPATRITRQGLGTVENAREWLLLQYATRPKAERVRLSIDGVAEVLNRFVDRTTILQVALASVDPDGALADEHLAHSMITAGGSLVGEVDELFGGTELADALSYAEAQALLGWREANALLMFGKADAEVTEDDLDTLVPRAARRPSATEQDETA